jgi:shikimate kinase
MVENIILIGMPNSGKSTLGKILAERLEMSFIDTDQLIKDKIKKNLRDIVNEDGLEKFLEIQENILLNLKLNGFVISTGGSVIYADAGMRHLKKNGKVVFLNIPFEEVEKRSLEGRRFARAEGQSVREMYDERQPLYRKYADIEINCGSFSIDNLISEIIGSFK